MLRRRVWSRNIKNRCSIYIYNVRLLRVNELLGFVTTGFIESRLFTFTQVTDFRRNLLSPTILVEEHFSYTQGNILCPCLHRLLTPSCSTRLWFKYHTYSQESWTLKMGLIGWLRTSVRNYHYSLRNSPEERSCVIHCKFNCINLLQISCLLNIISCCLNWFCVLHSNTHLYFTNACVLHFYSIQVFLLHVILGHVADVNPYPANVENRVSS